MKERVVDELNAWIESLELNGDFERKLIGILFEHYLDLGHSIQEAQVFTEMDYIEYKKYPATFLLSRLNTKK